MDNDDNPYIVANIHSLADYNKIASEEQNDTNSTELQILKDRIDKKIRQLEEEEADRILNAKPVKE
jgi:hypothetical protein